MQLSKLSAMLVASSMLAGVSLVSYAKPLEICSVGSDCGYTVNHGSARKLTFTGFHGGQKYQCVYQSASCTESGSLSQFNMLNLTSDRNGVNINYIKQGNTSVQPGFGFVVDASKVNDNSKFDVQSDLKNDNLFANCSTVIHCSAQ